MRDFDKKHLEDFSYQVRKLILEMSARGGAFTGAALSCTDIVSYLYNHFLDTGPEKFTAPDRDYLFLSKGHVVPVLYGTFAVLGWLDSKRLRNHLKTNDDIYWHPNKNIVGIEFHSGSLGHGLPVAAGVALDCKMSETGNKVVVITGDGELNEGTIWESLLVASAKKLDNLLVIIDRNRFQANITTEDLIPLEPLEDKFRSFGTAVKRVSGHDFEEINKALSNFPFEASRPSVLIADTIRGKGVPSIEARADKWFVMLDEPELNEVLEELEENRGME
ncbi:MAG: transketolase [Bacteroidota bacterium]